MRWTAAQAMGWIIDYEPRKLGSWTTAMGTRLREAQERLRRAIAKGEVTAWGRPSPQQPYEEVPAEQFSISDTPVGIGVHGDMVPLFPQKPYTGPKWHSIQFPSEQMKKCFPAPLPPSITEWMRSRATLNKTQGKPILKRQTLLDETVQATGCTTRDAIAAYNELEPDLRRPRGKPRKRSE